GRAPAAVPDGTPTPTRTGGGVLAPLPAKRGAQSRCAAPRHPLARPYAHARTRARTHAYAGHRGGVCGGRGGVARTGGWLACKGVLACRGGLSGAGGARGV